MDPEFLSVCRKIESITWVIKVSSICKGAQTVGYGTGFSINNDGLIMSCSHIFRGSILSIKVRRLGEDGFTTDVELVNMREAWDISLLKVKGIDGGGFGHFAENGSICQGQTLYLLGHSEDCVGSLFVGYAAYPCVDDVTLPIHGETCFRYVCTTMETTPRYRVMGHIWNDAYFRRFESLSSFEENLNPLVPIIQVIGFDNGCGCSGGPVFNSVGEIVGMLVLGANGCQVAIHVTALKEFLKASTQAEKGKADDIGGTSAKDFSKGAKKRKGLNIS